MQCQSTSRIDVLVAATRHDVQAEGFAAAVASRGDMRLVGDSVLDTQDVDVFMQSLPSSLACAVIVVGPHADTEHLEEYWLAEHANLVVLRVDVATDVLHLRFRNIGLERLLNALRELVDRMPSGCKFWLQE